MQKSLPFNIYPSKAAPSMSQASTTQALTLDKPASAPVRLVQITDCHIYADADTRMRGMNTRHSLEAVCALIARDRDDFDALLATGDLSQDGSAESYRYLAGYLPGLGLPIFWIPGNHDEAAVMADVLVGPLISPARHLLVGAWQVLLLDSTLPGEVHGRVAPAQLEFLDEALSAYPERHALVCLHHQALEAGSRWIDEKGLHRSGEFRQRLEPHRQIRAVLWGHVHQEGQRSIGGVEWMSTPSTCIQFKPGIDEFGIDDRAPGYRELTLHPDGRVETAVRRADAFDFNLEEN